MEFVAIVVGLALVEYMVFGAFVGKARDTYNIQAPAVSGHEVFDRYFRVHQNTLEGLIIFIPSIYAFGVYVHAEVAAGIGVIFIIARVIYFKGYVKNPKSRVLGAILSGLSSIVLLLGGIVGAVVSII